MNEIQNLGLEDEWELYGQWIVTTYVLFDSTTENRSLLTYQQMHQTAFHYSVEMDYNREVDGRCLRARFLRQRRLPPDLFDDIRNVSVLEVLAAFAKRIDQEYTGDPGEPKPGGIFEMFMINLGLDKCDGTRYKPRKVDDILQKWMNREYGHDGEYGLFYVKNCEFDMRKEELWRQMNIWNFINLRRHGRI